MADLLAAVDALDRLVAAAGDVAGDGAVAEAATVARRVRRRRGFLGETVVVALAGGTGSGKTSLLNAIAGAEVGTVGARRPTTAAPLALVPADPEPGLVRLLDGLGIDERVGQAEAPWLAVIDLPDTDSVVEEHRATVERLLPEVDAVVWVVDPEKYQDRALHERYLGPLRDYGDHFLFAVNQIDRLDDPDVPAVLDDLAESLRRDGIREPVIVPTAADPPMGEPSGIDVLVGRLRAMYDAKRTVEQKLLVDLRRAGDRLVAEVGGGGTGFDAAWRPALDDAVGVLVDDAFGPAVEHARRTGRALGRSRVGVLAAGDATAAVAPDPEVAPGAAARAAGILETVVREAASRAGPAAGDLRALASGIEDRVVAASESILASWEIPLGETPGWWRPVRALRRLALVAAVAGAAWLAAAVAGEGATPAPVVLLVLAAAALVASRVDAGSAGAEWATRRVETRRDRLADALRRELDRTIGRPVRDLLRRRAAVAALHAELELLTSDAGGEALGSPP